MTAAELYHAPHSLGVDEPEPEPAPPSEAVLAAAAAHPDRRAAQPPSDASHMHTLYTPDAADTGAQDISVELPEHMMFLPCVA